MSSSRIKYYDELRGLVIVAVVAIHASDNGLQFEGYQPLYQFLLIISFCYYIIIGEKFLLRNK